MNTPPGTGPDGLWRAKASIVEKHLAASIVSVADVADAIDRTRDPYWTVDTRHAAWPRPKSPAVAITSPRPTPSARWAELHARSRQPVADAGVERQWVAKLADGLEHGCSCRSHWQAYLKADPPAVDTPEAYEAWAVAAHNTVNKRLGKREWTVEQARNNGVIVPDRVVVLSLDSRPDRWEALTASAKMSKYLSQWPIDRFRARLPAEMLVPDWWQHSPTIYATGRDHLTMIEQSYVAGHEHVLILEDDAIIQDGFDVAYEAACRALPDGWMGLWLTSDGHKRPPVPVARGLVRCTDQTMLHAYMLSRRGMHRVWHHCVERYKQIIDGATEDLHGIEPHFYAMAYNAVRQFGCRFKGDRVDFFDEHSKIPR